VVAKCSVSERISGSLDGKNGDEGGREEDKRSGAAWQVTRRWRSSLEKAWMGGIRRVADTEKRDGRDEGPEKHGARYGASGRGDRVGITDSDT
jgi:hypothetical protein